MTLAVCALLASAVGVSAARTQTASASSSTWHYFHAHVNAYNDSGSCTAEWTAKHGVCTGLLEEGTFVGYHYTNLNHTKARWSWEGKELHFWWFNHLEYIDGHVPANWHTYTVVSGYMYEQRWETGTTAPAGHIDGPLYVNLSHHGGIYGSGYSLDLHGYLRIKR